MPISEEADNSGLWRRFREGLSIASGLIAVFQFVVSDNVSSQWFKSIREWIADRLELSEGLVDFSGWWNAAVARILPDHQPFGQLPLLDMIRGRGEGIALCALLGFVAGAIPFTVLCFFIVSDREKAKLLLEIIKWIPVAFPVVGVAGLQLRGLLMSGPPEQIKSCLGVVALIGFASAIRVIFCSILRDGK